MKPEDLTTLIKTSINTFDKDLALMILLSGISSNTTLMHKRLAFISHVQNLRTLEKEELSESEIYIVEQTNSLLMAQYNSKNPELN